MGRISEPASKTTELVAELNRLRDTGKFTALDLARLRKEATAIKENVDLAQGFCLLGMIACLEGDERSMRSYAERAVQQSGGEPLYLINYAKSLWHFGLRGEAYERAAEACDRHPTDASVIDNMIGFACAMNKKDDFTKLTEAWMEMKGKPHELTRKPLFSPVDKAGYHDFLERRSSGDAMAPDAVLGECEGELTRIFGAPLHVALEVMPDSSHEPTLVAWIQWAEEMADGMARFDEFENWYIENDFDLKTNRVCFQIEFTGE